MIPKFDLQQLSNFVAVARARNFSRAAEELNVGQSSLSRSIQKLESVVGQPLFERKPREVVLTDLGEMLLDRAEQILTLVQDTYAEITESGESGRIRLAVIPTIAPYFLPEVLRDFRQQHANISVSVQEDTTLNIVKMCNHGEVDLAILALPLAVKYLDVEPLFDEELVLVMPNGHPLEQCPEIKLNDVVEYPFVMLDQAHCLSDNIESFCKRESLQPISVSRTSQLATVQELVSLSHGISMVPAMAQRLDESGRRTYRSFAGRPPMRTVAILSNPYRYESAWVKTFKEFLRATTQTAV